MDGAGVSARGCRSGACRKVWGVGGVVGWCVGWCVGWSVGVPKGSTRDRELDAQRHSLGHYPICPGAAVRGYRLRGLGRRCAGKRALCATTDRHNTYRIVVKAVNTVSIAFCAAQHNDDARCIGNARPRVWVCGEVLPMLRVGARTLAAMAQRCWRMLRSAREIRAENDLAAALPADRRDTGAWRRRAALRVSLAVVGASLDPRLPTIGARSPPRGPPRRCAPYWQSRYTAPPCRIIWASLATPTQRAPLGTLPSASKATPSTRTRGRACPGLDPGLDRHGLSSPSPSVG